MSEQTEPSDGRTARRDRNRDLVLDAVLELFAEDSLAPGPAEVAERSGVSLRSVYRYYEDMDALARAAIARHLVRMAPLFELEGMGVGPVDDRIERIVAARLRLYEAAAPMARASVVRARTNPIIRERLDQTRDLLRLQVDQMFAPELAVLEPVERAEIAAGLDLVLELESLEHLRRHRAMDVAGAHRVLVRAVSALIA